MARGIYSALHAKSILWQSVGDCRFSGNPGRLTGVSLLSRSKGGCSPNKAAADWLGFTILVAAIVTEGDLDADYAGAQQSGTLVRACSSGNEPVRGEFPSAGGQTNTEKALV